MKRSTCINNIINKYLTDENLKLKQINYLEIGIMSGKTIREVVAKNKYGVDPEPRESGKKFTNFKMTSDNFFKRNKKKYDIIFIDGLHLCEQVILDINNSLKCVKNNGYILIDDILPLDSDEQEREKIKDAWTGDVWKAWYYFFENNKHDLDFGHFESPIFRGVGYVKVNKIIDIDLKEAETFMSNLTFDEHYQDYKNLLLNDHILASKL